MPVAKEQIRQTITENNNRVSDVYFLLKDSFKDILQELLEAEMDAALGYPRNQKRQKNGSLYRSGCDNEWIKRDFKYQQKTAILFQRPGVGRTHKKVIRRMPA